MSVGLDIGSKTIKIVELERAANKFSLKAAGVVGYKGNTPEHLQEKKGYASLSEVIKKLFKDTKISSKNVVISLPEAQVFSRVISFPLLTDREIVSAVKWEAEQYIPIPLKEAIVQHKILERKENTTPPSVSVLLVAAPRVLVEKFIKVIGMAGLNCQAAETELMSLVRSLAPPQETVLLLDFGARSTGLAIAKNGQLSFSRSIPTAGEAFTRAVAQSLEVNPERAEEYKRTYGLSATQLEGKVGHALDPVFRVVAEEIKKAIHFYQSEEKGGAPTSLVLSGGSSGMLEASARLTKLLGIEVIVGNPFSKINIDASMAKSLANFAPLYAIAIGLAMRGD